MAEKVDADLLCPRCRLPLNQVQISGRIFWACSKCGGRALTVELLRRTFTPESINPLWLHVIRDEGAESGPCPSCRNPMIEVELSNDAGVRVDVCRICHFVWFDSHETDALIPKPLPAPLKKKKMSQKARETMAIFQVQQLAERAARQDIGALNYSGSLWSAIADFFNI